jgi:hypothetical protein
LIFRLKLKRTISEDTTKRTNKKYYLRLMNVIRSRKERKLDKDKKWNINNMLDEVQIELKGIEEILLAMSSSEEVSCGTALNKLGWDIDNVKQRIDMVMDQIKEREP